MTECSNREEQKILLELSENWQKEKLKIFFENYNPKISDIDLAIRKCINKFKKHNINHDETLKELFKHADINYCNPDFDSSNILMLICSKCEMYLFDLLCEQKYLNNNDKNKTNKQNNKNNNKENNTYTEIDLCKSDKNNSNVFHYLLQNKSIDNGINEFISKIMNYKGNNTKINSIEKKKELLTKPNNDGITPIVIILKKGWYGPLCLIFKYIDYQKYIIPCNNNNLIHCAIEGKNIKCIKKILCYCKSTDELKFKNKDGYTPLLYANKYKLFLVEKLIEQTEKYFDNKQFKNIILSIKEDNVYDILENYIIIQNNNYINKNIEEMNNLVNKDYNLLLNNLYKYKINQYILSSDYINLPCEWNILLIKIQYQQLLNYINNNKNKLNIISYLKEFSRFFENNLKLYKQIKLNEDISYSIDIIIYNKIIYHYKLCDYSSLFSIINYYFHNIYQENNNDNNYYKYITFVNISFILIEYFIFDNDEKISGKILEQLDGYLIYNFRNRQNYNENNIIIKYLNNNEIYNPFNPTWDDAYCYLYLLKSLYHIKYNKSIFENNLVDDNDNENEMNNVKKYLKEFKNSYNNCNYKEELINFNRLNGLYTIIKSYYYYLSNNINKSLYKISLIKKSLYEFSNEHKIFYLNSLGIINLKLKKYEISEYYLTQGINLFKLINNKNNPNDDILFYRMEYLIKMKYNLCLTLFYNKKYYDAYLIFEEIKNFEIIKNNTYFWYRYGLTALNLYLILLKKVNKNKKKEQEDKYKKYIKKISNKFINNNDYIENNSNDSKKDKDDLYMEFEKEYGNKDNNNNNFINNNSTYNKLLFLDLGINKNELYKKMKKKENGENINNDYIKYELIHNSVNQSSNIIKYLLLSIKCFKKVILLFQRPQFVIKRNKKMLDDIKSILNFYRKNEKPEIKNAINKISSNEYTSINNLDDLNISENTLFISCYMNLLFCLSLNEKYNEMLLLIKAFPQNIIKNNDNIKNKLNYYKLNALINLSKYKEVEKIIEDNKNSIDNNQKNNSKEFNCYNINNSEIETNISHKSYLLLADIFLNYKLKKYDQAEQKLNILINMDYYKNKDISQYYKQLMIYLLSLQNKKSQVVSLVKHRWNYFLNKYKNNINNINIINNDKNG